MLEKKLNINIDKLEWIYHIGDIHTRNLKRHREYREQFKKLIQEIKRQGTKNGILYISGDIAHSKTDMSPELIRLISELLKGCADIIPTIFILGNHDVNLNNHSRLDVLTPIYENINHPNLFYLKDSGVYNIADVKFVVMSILDNPSEYIKANEITGKTKIALFHGPVNKSITDVGYVITNRHITTDIFDGYHICLLGDIHRHQILQKYDAKNQLPIIVYPSSLVQQNFGESLKGHGMCTWNVAKRSFKFTEIPNDYGYYTLDVDNGIVPKVKDMPKKPRLRVRVSNTDSSQIKRVMTDIKKMYRVQDMMVTRTDSLNISKYSGNVSTSWGDITDVNVQNKFITDFLQDNFIIDDDTIHGLREINEELNLKIKDTDIPVNLIWKPIRFEFSNMFSFGPNNILEFDQMGGIIGIFAPNQTGKSSVFDAISFCLFDKSSRAYKALNIMNTRKNSFYCKLDFEVDGITYHIVRVAKKNKKGDNVKVNVEFWRIENGVKISMNGEERRDTNSIIRQYVGDYDDFVLTALSLQNNNSLFIDKSQTERKDLLSQFMGLTIFDRLYQLATEEIRESTAILKKFKRTDFTSDLANIENELELRKTAYAVNKKEKQLVKFKLTRLEKRILKLTEKLTTIDPSVVDIDDLNDRLKNSITELSTNETNLETLQSDISIMLQQQSNISKIFDKINRNNVQIDYDEYIDNIDKLNSVTHEIDKLRISVQSKLQKLKHLEKHEYDPNCKYCINNVFVKDAIQTRQELKSDKITAEILVKDKDYLKNYLEKNSASREKFEQLQQLDRDMLNLKADISTHEKYIEAITSTIDMNKISIDVHNSKIDEHNKLSGIILENQKINTKLESDRIILNDLLLELNDLDNSILNIHGKISSLENQKSNIQNQMDEAKELENRVSTYEYYLLAVKRDGVPYDLISKVIPLIEGETNNILQQIVDFGVTLKAEGKSINGKIVKENENWPLELTSGMEKFISGLAIRIALINISNLPRPNFLVIDEGFGTLDSDKLNSMYILFQYLKSQFDFVLIISHIDLIRDMVDEFIEVSKNSRGFSQINYS